MIGLSGKMEFFASVHPICQAYITWMSVDCFTLFFALECGYSQNYRPTAINHFLGWWFIEKNVQLHAIGAVAHGLPLAWCTTGIETLSCTKKKAIHSHHLSSLSSSELLTCSNRPHPPMPRWDIGLYTTQWYCELSPKPIRVLSKG